MPPLNIADFGGGATYLVMGALAALAHVRGGGEGQVVDASILDGVASLMTLVYAMRARGMWSDERGVNLMDGGCPFGSTYRTADNRYMMVCALEPSFFNQMIEGLGLDPAKVPRQQDRDRWPEMRRMIAERFETASQAHWAQLFAGSNACVTPVLTMGEAPHHPQNLARGVFVGPDETPAASPRFSATPTAHAPRDAGDGQALLNRWQGVSRAALAAE